MNKYSTASNSGSATAIHTGTTIQCPNPRNATTLVGASGSGPSAGASSSVPNNGHADGNTDVAVGSYGAHDNPHIRRSGPVNRSSPSKAEDVASISQIRNLPDVLGISHAWKSTHDYVLHTLNRQARESGLNTVPERHAPLSPVHVTNLGKERDSPNLVFPVGSPKAYGPEAKLNAADLVPVQGSFQRSPNYQHSRLIELITLMISKMVLLFLFLHLMKVQYTVISDPDPRLVVNP